MSALQLEFLTIPAHHGIELDHDQSILPAAPESGEQYTKETVSDMAPRAFVRAFHDG